MSALRVACPHCREQIRIDLLLTAVKGRRKGPRPIDPGPEVDAFIIEAIDEKKFSFATVAELLRDRGVSAPRGKNWYAASARRLYLQALSRREQSKE